MEDLFGMIIPLLAAAAWLFGSFKKQDEKNKPAEKNQHPRPTSTPSGRTDYEVSSPVDDYDDSSTKMGPQRYYEEKKQQLDQLKDHMEIGGNITSGQREQNSMINEVSRKGKNKKTNKSPSSRKSETFSIAKNMSKRGLAESIVMAEVLGPPKSQKPHRNIMQNRRS
ncbi:hypothetical protein [Aquibacillus rhizosphaerae]|uniref:Uncharacterized protein n=1 Tax=Aquibacillus rhizosphaerae TaxID=3051431 RepID=A0ABT7L6M9_9BACI|nr:hypothetical protein [Aquibacillus sp. LR5S19]MDL4841501.1 hypothetical protein [Aquibacillus sp. LR5S19]